MTTDRFAAQRDADYARLSAAGNPLAGLISAYDAEAARYLGKDAPQSHAAHGTCPGGLLADCTASHPGTGPRSAYNGNGPDRDRHGWFCPCSWCVQGVTG